MVHRPKDGRIGILDFRSACSRIAGGAIGSSALERSGGHTRSVTGKRLENGGLGGNCRRLGAGVLHWYTLCHSLGLWMGFSSIPSPFWDQQPGSHGAPGKYASRFNRGRLRLLCRCSKGGVVLAGIPRGHGYLVVYQGRRMGENEAGARPTSGLSVPAKGLLSRKRCGLLPGSVVFDSDALPRFRSLSGPGSQPNLHATRVVCEKRRGKTFA